MKLADSVMAGKASDGSIKWQLCYDISARTWWMVSWQPGLPFFFSFSPPFLLSLPLWQNVPDLTFIKLTFDFFHTLQWGLPHTASSCHPPSPCHSANLSSQDCLPLFSMGQYLAFGGFHIMVVITNKYFKRIESFKIEFCVFSHRCLQIAKEQFVLPLGFCALSLASHPLYFCFWELWGAGFSLAVKSSWGAYWAWE